MKCDACGTNKARVQMLVAPGEWVCDLCSDVPAPTIPDVYWGNGRIIENLVDERGQPIRFMSKGHKAAVLKEKGLSEIGDKIHGSPWVTGHAPTQHNAREEIRKAVAQVRNMTPGERRNRMHKIIAQERQRNEK